MTKRLPTANGALLPHRARPGSVEVTFARGGGQNSILDAGANATEEVTAMSAVEFFAAHPWAVRPFVLVFASFLSLLVIGLAGLMFDLRCGVVSARTIMAAGVLAAMFMT